MTDEPLCIPIRVHWSLAVLVGLVNVLLGALIVGTVLGACRSNPPGVEWLGIAFCLACLGVVDVLTVPMFRNARVQFDDDRLSLFLGLHKARIPYDGIDFVSERFEDAIGYVWKPTAPGAVRIHGRLHEEAVAVADKELLYEELLKRNPRIRIIR